MTATTPVTDKNLLLQRASAGSGKTFTLARKFISLLIGRKLPDGSRRLRSKEALADSLSHILAITFTVKATAEMKQRIIDRLRDLANWKPDDDEKPDYLNDLCEEYGAEPEAVGDICRRALAVLLHSYSDFNVSTIDSFFQSILRTFAYETQRNDTFNLEIESKLPVKAGIDATLSSLREADAANPVAFWVKRLMEEEAQKYGWNFFATRESANDSSLRSTLLARTANMHNEAYQRISAPMKAYFEAHPDFHDIYRHLEEHYNAIFAERKQETLEALEICRNKFAEAGYDFDVLGRSAKPAFAKIEKTAGLLYEDQIPKADKSTGLHVAKTKIKDADMREFLNSQVEKVIEALRRWKCCDAAAFYEIYTPGLVMLALMHISEENAARILKDNNSVELSETNAILARIIDDADAPFIYERIGTIIHHFLIDEFQDTSALQWNNLRPLVATSLAEGHDNLIIGDAKQSIYRFRNADSTLISRKVPEDFAMRLESRGQSKEDNTNWRSERRVVEFNNTLFHFFSRDLDESLEGDRKTAIDNLRDKHPAEAAMLGELKSAKWPRLADVYSNVVQYPHHRKPRGYVEVRLPMVEKVKGEDLLKHYTDLGPLIDSLREEGYRAKDIVILVRTNTQAETIIKLLMDYNATLMTEGREPINFMSEEALKVTSARSVQTITSILQDVANRGSKSRARIRQALGGRDAEIDKMLAAMPAMTLPSLVEAIIATFIPEAEREAEAPYLAAFEDALLEYTENYSADPASFLQWWKKASDKATITTPKSADAVQVMTIHKSKGLEFPVVIIADASGNDTRHPDNIWMPMKLVTPEGLELPPYVPIDITSKMAEYPTLLPEYLLNAYNKAMDALNCHYVAFTRAIERLYAFIPIASTKSGVSDACKGLGVALYDLDKTLEQRLLQTDEQLRDWMIDSGTLQVTVTDDGSKTLVFGTPGAPACVAKDAENNADSETEIVILRDFRSRHIPDCIHCREDASEDFHGLEGLRCVPRVAADIGRQILALAPAIADLPVAMRRVEAAGILDAADTEAMSRWLQSVAAANTWVFTESGYRVVTADDLLPMGKDRYVPDRLLIDGNGQACVVAFDMAESPANAGEAEKYAATVKQWGGFSNVATRIVPLPEICFAK